MARHVLVLAAGRGTRMKSDHPKVVHPVAGRPMVGWVLDAVTALHPTSVTVVVGHGADAVRAVLPPDVQVAHQAEQLGTGHAAAVALEVVDWAPGDTVAVVYGDTPLLEGSTLAALVESRETTEATVALLAADALDPGRYGRIIRRHDGHFERIVEFADATPIEAAVTEVNSGMYAFDAEFLAAALPRLETTNNQGEYYLTDLCADALAHGGTVEVVAMDYDEMAGVNTHVELAEAGERRRHQILRDWMLEGVAIEDPAATYVDATVTLHPGVRLRPGTHLRGATEVGPGSEIGPDTTLVDTVVGADSLVWYSVVRGADIGDGVEVGPYTSLRPGTRLGHRSKAGSFVETKNTVVGDDSKVPHLSYLGDATLGERVNVGAGTITCNYDGVDKHATEIGDDAFIGSDTMLVAPVHIGDRAVTGAGSTITRDVPDGTLAVERAPQKEIPGYGDRVVERKAAKRRGVQSP